MVRIIKKPTSTQVNALGQAYFNASESQKHLFKASLIKLSERDCKDYWRAFRQVWCKAKRIGPAPSAIIVAAYYELNFSIEELNTATS